MSSLPSSGVVGGEDGGDTGAPSSPTLSPADLSKLGDLPPPQPLPHFNSESLDHLVHKDAPSFLKPELEEAQSRDLGHPPPMLSSSFVPDMSKHNGPPFHLATPIPVTHVPSSVAQSFTLFDPHGPPPSSLLASALESVADHMNGTNSSHSTNPHTPTLLSSHMGSFPGALPSHHLSLANPFQLHNKPPFAPIQHLIHPSHMYVTPHLSVRLPNGNEPPYHHNPMFTSLGKSPMNPSGHNMVPQHPDLSMAFPKMPGSSRDTKLQEHTLDSHPSMSDLEGVRMMPPLSMCPPLPPLLKSHHHAHVGMEGRSPLSHWTQNDVLQWLDKIMLGTLRDVFQKHEISGDMLLELQEDDLRNEMGIHSAIIRRKLLRELKNLRDMVSIPKAEALCSPDMDSPLDDVECDLSQCVVELNRVMRDEGLSQPKVARALGIQSQGHLSELLRGKYKHSRNSSAQHWAKEIRTFLSLTPKERQDAISIYGQAAGGKKRKSSKRTVWSKEQALMLENFFRQKPSPSKPERHLLASQCGVDMGVISTYFQNKRRRSRHLQPQGM